MPSRWKPSGVADCRAALVLVLAFSGASAAPVVAVVERPSANLLAEAEVAFEAGAEESPGGRARDSTYLPREPRDTQAGLEALARGEKRYLAVELKAAKKALEVAVDALLRDPTELVDARFATRAALRLTQVCLALRQVRAADQVIERALFALPRFPAEGSPPPDLRARLEAVRSRVANQLDGRLHVVTRRPGAEVSVNGVVVGRTPLMVEGLARVPVRVVVRPDRAPAESRLISLAEGRAEVEFGSTDELLADLRGSVVNHDAEGSWRAARRLQSSFSADATCLAVVDDSDVVVARLDAVTREVLGGHRTTRVPGDAAGWRVLGRFSAPVAPSNLTPAEVAAALWSQPNFANTLDFGRAEWGWTTAGVGVATLGLGAYFGAKAFDADDRYSRTGTRSEKDDAESSALAADVVISVGAVLVGTGLYLLLTDE